LRLFLNINLGDRMEHAKKAPEALKILWSKNFFVESKGRDEIIEELHKNGYNFGYDATRMAIDRAEFLTCIGGRGTKKYLQKYPFSEETLNK